MVNREKGAVVITGASKGIGEACALHLDALGYQVFAGVRQPEDARSLQERASGQLTPIYLDVTNVDMIAAAAGHVRQVLGEGGLIGLVNNAGMAVAGPLEFLPLEAIRQQMEVNLLGQVAVTQAFLPLLRRERGRVINISSGAGRMANPFFGPYSMSKFALEAFSDALRRELMPWGMEVVSIQPGAIDTPIWETSLDRIEGYLEAMPEQADELYGLAMERQQRRALARGPRGLPAMAVAEVVAEALTARRPKTRYIVRRGGALLVKLARFLPDRLLDRLLTATLYR
jgi:NAD(P)-dependent dehydrogenase (short-subunit alcohol dehydrogenase family)